MFRPLLVGTSGFCSCGKACNCSFIAPGVDFKVKTIVTGGKRVKLSIWVGEVNSFENKGSFLISLVKIEGWQDTLSDVISFSEPQ